jgi:isoleucyl-tRNA synthetase
MHKSAGNAIDPMDLMKEYGADILRLWVSSEDYTQDVAIGPEMLNRLSEAYRRVRNTFRFILGNLADFDPAKDAVADVDLIPLDRWALLELRAFLGQVDQAYDRYEFTRVFHALDTFCAGTLSARYFDILKDRLYTHASASRSRRSAQTVLHRILRSLTVAVSPVLSFTAEEIWQAQADLKGSAESVFLADWPVLPLLDESEAKERQDWDRVFAVREEVARALEGLRQAKTIGSSLEAEIDLWVDGEGLRSILSSKMDDLRYYFLTSRVTLHAGQAPADALKAEKVEGLWVKVAPTSGAKCARCWNYYPFLGEDATYPDLCGRCAPVVRALGTSGGPA